MGKTYKILCVTPKMSGEKAMDVGTSNGTSEVMNNNPTQTHIDNNDTEMDTGSSDATSVGYRRVYTSMPGNSAFGPRYISAPYVSNCGACSNGASGHSNHTLT